jgi:formylglycine-generating enzyme required for sulfatase activity
MRELNVCLPCGSEIETDVTLQTKESASASRGMDAVLLPLQWPPLHPRLHDAAPVNPVVQISGAPVTIGKPNDAPTFGWDNEYGRLRLQVPDFEVSKYQITNSEFLEFVRAGGYRNERLWSQDGWRWCDFALRSVQTVDSSLAVCRLATLQLHTRRVHRHAVHKLRMRPNCTARAACFRVKSDCASTVA